MNADLLSDSIEIVDAEEDDDEDGRPRQAAVTNSGFLAPPPSLFAFTLRSAVAKAGTLRGPWAELPTDALPPAALRDVVQELTLTPHQMVGGIKRLQAAVPCFEHVEEKEDIPQSSPPQKAAARARAPPKAAGKGAARSEPAYRGRLRVPRAYFTERFGRPDRDETALGLPIAEDVAFDGALRDERQRGFVARMVHTLIELKQTIALGSAEPGCGKTVMFLFLWANVLRRKCLVIVHGLPIVAQWIGAVRKFCPSAAVGIIHQDTWQIRNRDIVVASSDTLASRAELFNEKLWQEFGVVCFDEAHHIMAGTFLRIYRNCMHARFCISLTGTPYRKDGLTPAMPFLTGPNAAFMKNTDPVHVRVVEFGAGRQSFVGFKFGPAAGKPNESAMISAMVEDETRTALLVDIIRSCVLAGRKVLVLCARNDLREAIRLLCLETLESTPCPHLVRSLRDARDNSTGGLHDPDGPPPSKRSKAVRDKAATERRLRAAMDAYDTIYMEPYRIVPTGPLARREMADKLLSAESKLSPEHMEVVASCRGMPPKVVPELDHADFEQPASWIESLNAGDDYLTRMNKQQARAILATYVMAREALDVPGLDTLVLATPSSDVRQAVGRIRRTGKSVADERGRSVLEVKHALVIDVVDTFQPFLQWASARQRYYRDERFDVSKVKVFRARDKWDEFDAPADTKGPQRSMLFHKSS
jgi:hypothetical protein